MSKVEIAEALILAQKRRHDQNELHRNQRRRTTAVSTVTDGFASLWSFGSASVQEPNASDESGCEETDENDVGQYVEDMFDEESPWCSDAVLEDLMQSSGVPVASQSKALHNHTDVSVVDFCRSLVVFTRKSNLCKTHVKDLLDLINSALPQPNYLPTSVSSLLEKVSVENLFTKRQVCLSCKCELRSGERYCSRCRSTEAKQLANIYDADLSLSFSRMLDFLSPSIDAYRDRFLNCPRDESTNDIPYNKNYRLLLDSTTQPFISIIIHLDGISLSRSSNQPLWLLSCSIVELPPHLRVRRYNMPVLSVWIAQEEPSMELWLRDIISQLQVLKERGVQTKAGTTYVVRVYGVLGDCPALKMALCHIGHVGYWPCWYCELKGEHVGGKRQYRYTANLVLRTPKNFLMDSKLAEKTKERNIKGRRGVSAFHHLVDIPLPLSCIADYLHVTLLRHGKTIYSHLYHKHMKPAQRTQFDLQLTEQCYPHFFHRKVRSVKEPFLKATELRNALLYALLPLVGEYLSNEVTAHLALFVCALRLLHGKRLFGDDTSSLANGLFSAFYRDHEKYYSGCQNFTLHLHTHFAELYHRHGSLSNISTFAHEDLIGYFGRNKHGTRHWDELVIFYFNIDFAVHFSSKANAPQRHPANGPFDETLSLPEFLDPIAQAHAEICGCSNLFDCIHLFRRCVVGRKIFHSLAYTKRGSSVSYFVQYNNGRHGSIFGAVLVYVTCRETSYAIIQRHERDGLFSDRFVCSAYHALLVGTLDVFFHVLCRRSEDLDIVPVENLIDLCLVFDNSHSLIVTCLSAAHEHD